MITTSGSYVIVITQYEYDIFAINTSPRQSINNNDIIQMYGRISKVKWFNINKSINRVFKTKT